jgi:hypothetical protein
VADWWDGLDTSTRTQNGRAYELLKSVMAEAVEDELIPRNPCRVRGAGKPRPSHEGEALTVDEVLAYLEAVPESSRLALMTAAWCGLRSGEVRGSRRCDVDLINGVLRIEQAVQRAICLQDHRQEPQGDELAGLPPPDRRVGHRGLAWNHCLSDHGPTAAGHCLLCAPGTSHLPIRNLDSRRVPRPL